MHLFDFSCFPSAARVFLEMKKYKDAIVQLKLLMQFANYRYEVYDYLITAYIASNKLREAHQTATEACTYLGKTPRTYLVRFISFASLDV